MRTVILFAVLAMLSACAAPMEQIVSSQPMGDGVYLIETDRGTKAIGLTDGIDEGTDDAFIATLNQNPEIDLVILRDNDGGYIEEAQDIGRIIRSRGMRTVAQGWCASACVDVFVAGTTRSIDTVGRLGIHSPDITDDWVRDMDLAYYTAMGVPQMYEMTYSVPHWDMVWLWSDDARSYGLIE